MRDATRAPPDTRTAEQGGVTVRAKGRNAGCRFVVNGTRRTGKSGVVSSDHGPCAGVQRLTTLEPGAAGTCISIAQLLYKLSTHVCTPGHALVSPVRGLRAPHAHTFHISPREAGAPAALLPLFPLRPGTHSSSPSSHVTHAEMFTYLAWVAVRSYVRQTVLLRSGRPSCPLSTALPCCLRLRQWPEAMASPVA